MRLAYLILPLTAAFGVSAIPMVHQAKPELQAASVLIAEDQQAISNEPASLQILVTPAPQNESLKVVGLAAGARLSAGVVVEGSSWQLPARDLNSVSIYPPADYVGTMHVMVALLSQDQKLLGLRPVRLQWIAKNSDSAQAGSPTKSGYTNAVAVPPTDYGEDVAMQKVDSSQLGDQTNSINTNAVAVQPTDHGEDVTTQKADSSQLGDQTNSVNKNPVAVQPIDHGEDVATQKADSSQLGDQTNSINTNAVAVQPTDHGEDVATQKAGSSQLGDQTNSVNTNAAGHGEDAAMQKAGSSKLGEQTNSVNMNAVAVEPTKSGEDAAVQKADAALALIRELGIDGTRGKIRLRNLLTRHIQSQLPQSPLPDRSLNPRPYEFGQARL